MNLVKNLIQKFRGPEYLQSGNNYIKYLKEKGVKIGNGTIIFNPRKIQIDVTRPELVTIGDNVFLHSGTVIMTHDWASWCFVRRYNDFLPSHGRVTIGNNVWLGENVTILKNVTIGDNVIIGAGSIVTKSIPSNSVAVGVPAKVISTFDGYYEKRKSQYVEEAIEYALAIYERGRTPVVEDFYDDYPAFVDGRNYMDYDYPYSKIFTPTQFEEWKQNHHAPFNGFDEFLKEVNERRRK